MVPEFSREPRELPWQPKLGKNKLTLHRFQFSTGYGANACVYSRISVIGEFKYANKKIKGAKGAAIATKFRQKAKNAQISVLVTHICF